MNIPPADRGVNRFGIVGSDSRGGVSGQSQLTVPKIPTLFSLREVAELAEQGSEATSLAEEKSKSSSVLAVDEPIEVLLRRPTQRCVILRS